MFSLLPAGASFKKVEMETIFYLECWIISGVSLPEILKYACSLWMVVFLLHSFFKTIFKNQLLTPEPLMGCVIS